MARIIDVSSYQGAIDWAQVSNVSDIKGAIVRTTIKNGNLDPRCIENINGALSHFNGHFNYVAGYKFAYANSYITAYMEAVKTLELLGDRGALKFLSRFYLDLENRPARFTKSEANEVIKGYLEACNEYGVVLGLYCNYDYIKHVIDDYWKSLPLWLARYNNTMGDISPFTAELWQFTSAGSVPGIKGNVDISREV